MNKKVIIIGGVAGGASTAARLRRNDEFAEIIMIDKGEYISFANCGLPYHIGGVIKDRSKLLLQTPESFNKRFNVDVRVKNEVISIDKEKKEIKVKNLNTNEEYLESYDVLVLSPGSTPIKPPIKGIESDNIFVLWNMNDMDKIIKHISDNGDKKAAVIGGGFIGIEMAENLYDLKMDVSIVEMADQVMGPVDFDMAAEIHNHIRDKKVNLILSDGVDHFEQSGTQTKIVLKSKKELLVDLVILSIGIRPQSILAKNAGLEMNARGGIVVSDSMETSDPSIFAVGDAIEVRDFNTNERTMVPLAGPANKQGRIAADVIAGKEATYKGTQGTSVAKVFDLTVASTGLNEKQLKKLGKVVHKDYETIMIHPKSNAGYYPGAFPLTFKTIFDMNGKVLGAQIVGYKGVDKRIDVMATLIRYGGTVYELKDLELSYAPPYSSGKSPENMAGFVGENILTGKTNVINYYEIADYVEKGAELIDVRTTVEYDLGSIPNSTHIDVDTLRSNLDKLDKNKTYIIFCQVGVRGYIAEQILKGNGFKHVYNLTGGYSTYNCIMNTSEKNIIDCTTDIDDVAVETTSGVEETLDACGLSCPGPIVQVYKKMETMKQGDVLTVKATDPGFKTDIGKWCEKLGHKLLDSGFDGEAFFAKIEKNGGNLKKEVGTVNHDKSMVVFSDDLDKAIAAFIIANGAAAMGRKVTMFFTFWGLNIIKKPNKQNVKKNFISTMFSSMTPRGSKKLKLSKMNMAGMGPKMIRGLMDKNNVGSLEDLIHQAMASGVHIIACNMSMDLMGVTQEEIIDGVDFAGVATYLAAAEEADTNLFI